VLRTAWRVDSRRQAGRHSGVPVVENCYANVAAAIAVTPGSPGAANYSALTKCTSTKLDGVTSKTMAAVTFSVPEFENFVNLSIECTVVFMYTTCIKLNIVSFSS